MFENSLGFNLNYYLNEIASNNLDKKFNNSCIWRNFLNCWKFFKIKLKNNGIYKEDINNKNDNLNFIIKKKIKNDFILQKIRNISENYEKIKEFYYFINLISKYYVNKSKKIEIERKNTNWYFSTYKRNCFLNFIKNNGIKLINNPNFIIEI